MVAGFGYQFSFFIILGHSSFYHLIILHLPHSLSPTFYRVNINLFISMLVSAKTQLVNSEIRDADDISN